MDLRISIIFHQQIEIVINLPNLILQSAGYLYACVAFLLVDAKEFRQFTLIFSKPQEHFYFSLSAPRTIFKTRPITLFFTFEFLYSFLVFYSDCRTTQ